MQKNNIEEEKSHTVLFTGGHAGTTAIAVIAELLKESPNLSLHWVGSKRAIEGKNALTLEARVLPDLGVKFHTIIAGKLQRKWSRHTLLSILKIPVGFIHAFHLLNRIKPKLTVSFGGYSALPVVVASFILRIPVILQEQITGLGLANRLSLPFVTKVLLSRKEGLDIAGNKGLVLGNPVNSGFTKIRAKLKIGTPPTIFIFAGSRGSQTINNVVLELLPMLLKKYKLIHQTGELDYERVVEIKANLTNDLRNRYEVFAFIDPSKVPSIYDKSDILIGRSGANTVSEIMVSGIPSILIPFPYTNFKDQEVNAKAVKQRGLAYILDQNELSSETLLKALESVESNWNYMTTKYKKDLKMLDSSASQNISHFILDILNDSKKKLTK